MSRLKKVKKANGQIIACNEVRAHPATRKALGMAKRETRANDGEGDG